MAKSEEELKNLLMKMKEESENVGLKLNIHKTKIMASGPITSWQIDGETVRYFIFVGSKITEDGDCNHEIKRHSMEKEVASHSSTLAWKIPWTEELGRLLHGVAKSRTRLSNFFISFFTPWKESYE